MLVLDDLPPASRVVRGERNLTFNGRDRRGVHALRTQVVAKQVLEPAGGDDEQSPLRIRVVLFGPVRSIALVADLQPFEDRPEARECDSSWCSSCVEVACDGQRKTGFH